MRFGIARSATTAAAVLAAAGILLCYPPARAAGPRPRLETRVYPINPGATHQIQLQKQAHLVSTNAAPDYEELFGSLPSVTSDDVREFLRSAGVEFPEGSSVVYSERTSRLQVRNTSANLAKIDDLQFQFGWIPTQLEVQLKLLEIRDRRAAAGIESHTITGQQLLALAGRGVEVVDSIQVTTVSGEAALIAGKGPAGSESSLNVTPTLGPNRSLINLTIAWILRVPVPGAVVTSTNAPVASAELLTQVVVQHGESLAIKIPRQPDGDQRDLWAVVTARVVDPSGRVGPAVTKGK